jgi:hypothetical protein
MERLGAPDQDAIQGMRPQPLGWASEIILTLSILDLELEL